MAAVRAQLVSLDQVGLTAGIEGLASVANQQAAFGTPEARLAARALLPTFSSALAKSAGNAYQISPALARRLDRATLSELDRAIARLRTDPESASPAFGKLLRSALEGRTVEGGSPLQTLDPAAVDAYLASLFDRAARPGSADTVSGLPGVSAAVPARGRLFSASRLVRGSRIAKSVLSAAERDGLRLKADIDRSETFTLAGTLYQGSPHGADGGLELKWWLEAQEERSVTPEAFLKKSLELAEGDVWRALRIGWTVLAEGRELSDRNLKPKARKLADLRGDAHLYERFHGKPGAPLPWTSKADNFSAWYHFWGTMMSAFFREASFTAMPVPGRFGTYGMILLEEFLQGPIEWLSEWNFRPYADLHRRVFVDFQGAVAGSALARAVNASSGLRGELSRKWGGLVAVLPAAKLAVPLAPLDGWDAWLLLLCGTLAGWIYLKSRVNLPGWIRRVSGGRVTS